MQKFLTVLSVLCLAAGVGWGADLGVSIPMPGQQCECPLDGICTCPGACECGGLMTYEAAALESIAADRPMVVWVNAAPATYQATSTVQTFFRPRFLRVRTARLFGVDRPRLVVARPFRGRLYWTADLDANASASAIAQAIQAPIPGLGAASSEARQGATTVLPPAGSLPGGTLTYFAPQTAQQCFYVNGVRYCR